MSVASPVDPARHGLDGLVLGQRDSGRAGRWEVAPSADDFGRVVVHRYTDIMPRVGRQTGPTAPGTELGSRLGGRAKGTVGFGVEDVVVDHDTDVHGIPSKVGCEGF